MKAYIVYYSATGNTETLAHAIMNHLEDKGVDASNHFVMDVQVDDVLDGDLYFLGCPAMGVEEIDEYDFRPFYEDLKPHLEGKRVVLFGSYDWGDGEWMDLWENETREAGAEVCFTFKANMEPSEEDLDDLRLKVDALV